MMPLYRSIIPYKILIVELIYIAYEILRNYRWICKPSRKRLILVWNI